VAVHVVPAALVNPVTVTVAGDASVIVVGEPVTVPDVHDTLTGTLARLLSEKSLRATNDADVGVVCSFVNVQVTFGCAASCLLRSMVAGLTPLTPLSGLQWTDLTSQPFGSDSLNEYVTDVSRSLHV
jgi:hypothetical protein